MSEWYKRTRTDRPPNKQNSGRIQVPVSGGTTTALRYGCAGCRRQLSEDDSHWVVESSRINAKIATKWGAFYVYASGSAYPSGNRSWPYCEECYDALESGLLENPPELRKETSNGEKYLLVRCSFCEHHSSGENMTPFVLSPTKVIHKKGGPGMTASKYPCIRGEGIRIMCPDCKPEFAPVEIEDIEEETVSVESVKVEYENDSLDELGLEDRLEEELKKESESADGA